MDLRENSTDPFHTKGSGSEVSDATISAFSRSMLTASSLMCCSLPSLHKACSSIRVSLSNSREVEFVDSEEVEKALMVTLLGSGNCRSLCVDLAGGSLFKRVDRDVLAQS